MERKGGRQLGARNRYTYATKKVLADVVNAELQHLSLSLASMSDVDRAHILVKLLPYVLPRHPIEDAGEDVVHVIKLA